MILKRKLKKILSLIRIIMPADEILLSRLIDRLLKLISDSKQRSDNITYLKSAILLKIIFDRLKQYSDSAIFNHELFIFANLFDELEEDYKKLFIFGIDHSEIKKKSAEKIELPKKPAYYDIDEMASELWENFHKGKINQAKVDKMEKADKLILSIYDQEEVIRNVG